MPEPILNVYNTKLPPVITRTNGQLIWDSANPTAYEDNSANNASSFFPVTVDMTGQATVEVTIDVDADLIGVPFVIQADQGEDGSVFSNDVPLYLTYTGLQTIPATVKPSWQSPTFPWLCWETWCGGYMCSVPSS